MNKEEIEVILQEHGYEIQHLIGKGGFSVCYSVYSYHYKQVFVCKILCLEGIGNSEKKRNFQNEIDALSKMTHPNIIKVFDTFSTDEYMFLVLQNCSNGDFNKFIKENGPITDTNKLLGILSKILNALAFLEENNIAHKDIKPSNIFIDKYSKPIIADFGLATKYKKDHLCNNFTCSLFFTAPEVISRKPYDSIKADVWSFGITTLFLATGEYPFPLTTAQDIKKAIKFGLISIPSNLDITIHKIISNCLFMDPEKRSSFRELKNIVDTAMKDLLPQLAETRRPLGLVRTSTRFKSKTPMPKTLVRSSLAFASVHRSLLRRL